MADLRIRMPGVLDPGRGSSDLSRTLRRKICEGITRKVGEKIDGLTQLRVKPFDANLSIGGLNTSWNLRQVKVAPLDASLHLNTDLDFSRSIRPFKMRMLKTTPVGGDLDLQTDLAFGND